MLLQFPTIGRQNSKLLVDKSTASINLQPIDIAKLKETQHIAKVLLITNGTNVNLMDLYNEMWIFDKETIKT